MRGTSTLTIIQAMVRVFVVSHGGDAVVLDVRIRRPVYETSVDERWKKMSDGGMTREVETKREGTMGRKSRTHVSTRLSM